MHDLFSVHKGDTAAFYLVKIALVLTRHVEIAKNGRFMAETLQKLK